MKYIYSLCAVMMALIVGSYSQSKRVVNTCSLMSNRPAVMAFKIPTVRSDLNNKDLPRLKKVIANNYVVDAEEVNAASFAIDSYSFIEMVYKGKDCDTSAILFIVEPDDTIVNSQSYKIDKQSPDFRISKNANQIILYRQIELNNKKVTVSFEFNAAKHRVDNFVDDGLSIW